MSEWKKISESPVTSQILEICDKVKELQEEEADRLEAQVAGLISTVEAHLKIQEARKK